MGVNIKKYKGSWYVFINHHGRRKAKKVGSREAAERVKREIEARLALGDGGSWLHERPALPNLTEYAEAWQKHHPARQTKPSTEHFYAQFLRLYVLPTFGASPLDDIQRDAVKRWVADLTIRGLARNTVRLAIASLRVVLNAAIEDNLIGYNPAQKLGRFVKVERPPRQATALTAEEANRFLGTARRLCPKHYALFLTALRAGLREGEILALRWGDIQFGEGGDDANRYILVQRNYDRRSGRFLTPKSNKQRRVDMSRELRTALLESRDRALLRAFEGGQDGVDDNLVFPSEVGTVLDITNLVPRHFLPLLERAGLRRIRFHDLRHTYGSLLIQAGAPLTYVRDQMGHSTIKITVDVYGHLVPGADVGYVDRLDFAPTRPPKSATQAQPAADTRRTGGPQLIEKNGAPGGTRTPDLQIRSLPLYPAELQARIVTAASPTSYKPTIVSQPKVAPDLGTISDPASELLGAVRRPLPQYRSPGSSAANCVRGSPERTGQGPRSPALWLRRSFESHAK